MGEFEGVLPKKGPASGKGRHGKQLFPSLYKPRAMDGAATASVAGQATALSFPAVPFVAFSPCFQLGFPLCKAG